MGARPSDQGATHLAQMPSHHRVLLTFDDGPDPLHTPLILNELARRELKAVFFVSGERLESAEHLALLEQIAAAGHVIGNHGYSHVSFPSLSDEEVRTSIQRTKGLIGCLDRGIKLWRPPFGDRDARVEGVVAELGYTRMLWNIDSMDFRTSNEARWVPETLQKIRWRQQRGFCNSVCLFHDALPTTTAQLSHLLDAISALPAVYFARYAPWRVEGLCSSEVTDPEPRPTWVTDAASFSFDNSRVLARPGMNAVYVLNDSAALLWDILDGGASESDAAEKLAAQYDIEIEQAAQGVQSALAEWRRRGLIGPKPPEMEDPGPWVGCADTIYQDSVGEFEEERHYRFLDLHFTIRFATADLAEGVHPRFANLEVSAPSGAPHTFEIVAIDSGCGLRLSPGVLARHSSPPGAAYQLFFEIVRLSHPQLQPMACLHGSLLASERHSIGLIGNNGSGKSTLTAASASCGLAIVSDDRLFLDFATSRPAATPNCVSLKKGSWSPLLSRYPHLPNLPLVQSEGEDLRFLAPAPPTNPFAPPVNALFFPRYLPEAKTAATPLTGSQALERIAAAESWISSEPAKLERFLHWLEGVRCYDLPYANLDQAVDCVTLV